MGQKVLNKRSVQVINNGPKLPTPGQLEYGELAINYADGHETLAIKNNQNEIVPFSSDEQIYSNVQTQIDNALVPVLSAITDITSAITDDEFVVATALADLDERIQNLSDGSEGLNELILELSGSVIDNYALSAVTHQEITDATDTLTANLGYVSGGLVSFSATVREQYATKQQVREASANAVSTAVSSAKSYVDAVSGRIVTFFSGNYATSANTYNAINGLNTSLETTNQNLNYVSGAFVSFSGYIKNNYATKTEVASASANAISSAKSYVDAASGNIENTLKKYALSSVTYSTIESAKTELNNRIDGISTEISELSGSVIAFSASVRNNYSTKAEASEYAAAALANAMNYTDTASGNIQSTFGDYAKSAYTHNAIAATNSRVDNLNTSLNALSGSVSAFSATVVDMESDLIERIESALTVVYKFKGSVETFDDLWDIMDASGVTNGDVYNVYYPNGTSDTSVYGVNFAWVEDESNPDGGYWDELGGWFDLSQFVTWDSYNELWNNIDGVSRDLTGFSASILSELIDDEYVMASALNELNDNLNTLCGRTEQFNSKIEDFSASVVTNYALSGVTHQEITTMGDNLRLEIESFSGNIISEIEDNEYTVSLAVNELNDKITEINNETIPDIYDSIDTLTNELIDDEYAIALSYDELYKQVSSLTVSLNNILNGTGGGALVTEDDLDDIYNEIDNLYSNLNNYVYYDTYNAYTSNTYNSITALSATVRTVSGNLSTLSASVKTISGNVRNTINTLSANTHNKINTVSGYIASALYGLSGAVSTLDIYATKAEASEYAAAALANAIAYTDTLSSNTYNALTAATGADLGSYALSANVNSLVATTSGNIESTIKSVSGNIKSTIDTASGNIRNTITSHTSNTSIHLTSGNIKTQIEEYDYATRAQASEYASVALSNAMDYTDIASGNIKTTIASLSANTHNTIKSVSGYIKSTIETTASNTLTSATQSINSASGNIESTIKSVSGYIKSTIETTASNTLTSATQSINSASGNIESTIKSASGNIKNTITTLSSNTHNTIATVSGNIKNTITTVSGNIKSYVDSKVVGVYRYKGSVTNYSDLSSISQKEHGDVYNVENANGNTPAGTNYAWNTGTTSWDALGGSVDLSSYLQASVFNSHTGDTTIHFTTGDVKNQIEAYNYLTGFTETDPTVPNWAKASTKPTYTASEVGALPTGTTLDGISDGITRKLSNYALSATVNTISGNIETTIKSVSGNIKNTITSVSGNIKNTITSVSGNIRNTITAASANIRTTITSHTSNTAIHLPTVSASDNGKILQVVNGAWALVTPVSIFSGSTAPDNLLGNNGDIYLQI